MVLDFLLHPLIAMAAPVNQEVLAALPPRRRVHDGTWLGRLDYVDHWIRAFARLLPSLLFRFMVWIVAPSLFVALFAAYMVDRQDWTMDLLLRIGQSCAAWIYKNILKGPVLLVIMFACWIARLTKPKLVTAMSWLVWLLTLYGKFLLTYCVYWPWNKAKILLGHAVTSIKTLLWNLLEKGVLPLDHLANTIGPWWTELHLVVRAAIALAALGILGPKVYHWVNAQGSSGVQSRWSHCARAAN